MISGSIVDNKGRQTARAFLEVQVKKDVLYVLLI